MKKILKVAQREYVETVKTRAFLLGILLMPVLIGAIIFISFRLQKESFSGSRPPKHIVVMNLSVELSGELESVFNRYNESHSSRKIIIDQYSANENNPDSFAEKMKNNVRSGELDGYLIIDEDVLENSGKAQFYSRNITDIEFITRIHNLTNEAVVNSRLKQHNLSPELIARLRHRITMEQIDLSAKTEKKRSKIAMFMVPLFFLFLMFFGIFTTSQGLLMSVIEEKASRVIEVLLSAVSPFQLMAGKILGQSAVGLTLVVLYGTASYVTATIRGLGDFLSAGIFVYFVIYYFLGFLLISSMIAAIGSACSTVKESQGLMGPIMLMFMIPMFTWQFIVQQPEGTLAIVLSFFPPTTSIVMILRIAARPDLSLLQIIPTIVILAVSVPVVIWMSAKIFRTGILMYGKQPSLREMLRWVRSN